MSDFTKHDARLEFRLGGRPKNVGWYCIRCGAKSTSMRMTYETAKAQAELHNGGGYNISRQDKP